MKTIDFSRYYLIMAALDFAELVLSRSCLYDPYLSNQEFIHLIGISDRVAQTIRALKLIPFRKTGNIIIYRISDIRNYINAVHEQKSLFLNA